MFDFHTMWNMSHIFYLSNKDRYDGCSIETHMHMLHPQESATGHRFLPVKEVKAAIVLLFQQQHSLLCTV
jgi:hypothetical protein